MHLPRTRERIRSASVRLSCRLDETTRISPFSLLPELGKGAPAGLVRQSCDPLSLNWVGVRLQAKFVPGHPNVLTCMDNLANLLADSGRLDQAIPLYEQALASGVGAIDQTSGNGTGSPLKRTLESHR